jgi:hypothetical protein
VDRFDAPEIRIQPRVPEPGPKVVPQRPPEPEPLPVAVEPEPEPEPAPMVASEPVIDMDDLDTPAYLRQRRLLN